ncbi:TPA: ADP-ribosyltransferase, partial [Staphylococcus aureus]
KNEKESFMKRKLFFKIIFVLSLVLSIHSINDRTTELSNIALADDVKNFTDLTEATNWGNKLIKQANYSSKDKEAIYNYTKYSSPINTPLRSSQGDISNFSADLQEKILRLDRLISKSSTSDSVYVYRLLNLDYLSSVKGFSSEDLELLYKTENGKYNEELVKKLNNIMNSKIYTEYGYSSTQLVKGAALAGRPIELKLQLPKGTKAAYIDSKNLTAYPGQQEILLPRGTDYTINTVKLSDDHKRILIEGIVFKK